MDWCVQHELRDAAAARDAHKGALDLAQQGLAELENALAKEQAAHLDSAREVNRPYLMLSAPRGYGPTVGRPAD